MNNFNGYFMKCNDCTFQNPSFKREGYKFAPNLIITTKAGTVASGKVTFQVLPHSRRKIWCKFPPMTPEQYRVYSDALKFKEKGPGMNLEIEAYDIDTDTYITDTYYHNDIAYTPVYYNGQLMVQVDDFELIGH